MLDSRNFDCSKIAARDSYPILWMYWLGSEHFRVELFIDLCLLGPAPEQREAKLRGPILSLQNIKK